MGEILSETRRILEISGTYYVSLPRAWIRFHKLKKGDKVFINMTEDGSLEISPKEVKELEKIRNIEILLDDYIDRRILAAYLSGYDIIEATTYGKIVDEHRRKIEEISSKLIGLEIVEETQNKVVLQCFSKGVVDVWSIIRRMGDVAKSMHSDAIIALIRNDTELARSISKRDDNVDRLYFFAVRIIRSSLSSLRKLLKDKKLTAVELLDYRLLAKAIEQIADHGEKLAEIVIKILERGIILPENIKDDLLNISKNLGKAQNKVLNAYKSKNLIEAVEVVKDVHSIYDKLGNIESSFKRRLYEEALLIELIDQLRGIARIIEDMGDLVF